MTEAFPDLGPLSLVHHHVGYAVRDLDEAMDSFGTAHGVTWQPVVPMAERSFRVGADRTVEWALSVVKSTGDLPLVELLQGVAGSTWHTGEPAVMHHFGFWSDDVEADYEALGAQGWQPDLAPVCPLSEASFAYLRKPGRPRIELFRRVVAGS